MRTWAVKYPNGKYYTAESPQEATDLCNDYGDDARAVEVEIAEVGSDPVVAKNATPEISERERLAKDLFVSSVWCVHGAASTVYLLAPDQAFKLADDFLAYAKKEHENVSKI